MMMMMILLILKSSSGIELGRSHIYIYYMMYSHYKPIERSIHNKGNGNSEMILKALNSGLCFFFFILPCCVSLLANIY